LLLVPHFLKDLPQPVLSDGESALPASVGGVGRGEALGDGEVFAESGQRVVEAALPLANA
jgi:hypothetical protein